MGYPVFDVPTIIESAHSRVAKRSWRFDFQSGDFETDGGNKVQEADEYVAWAQWCIKCVQTERFSKLAYTSDIGIESAEIHRQTSRKGAEAVLEKTITEALRVHLNTESVRDFTFTWNTDQLIAEFIVYPREGAPLEAATTIKL